MKITVNAKRYDTNKMELIAETDVNHNGLYAGSNSLYRASDGIMFEATTSNGQDCYRSNEIWLAEADAINNYDMTPEQEQRATELGLITMVQS